jgi:DNA-binding CsgD family transcriptional regulator
MRPKAPVRRLTPREREIALLVADDLTDAVIAARLDLKLRTVTAYVRRVGFKLDLVSRAELVTWVTARRHPDFPEDWPWRVNPVRVRPHSTPRRRTSRQAR